MEEQIAALGPWFHNMKIGGVETAPDHFLGDYPAFKWATFQHVLPDDMSGMTVLDIGCNAGFYSLEMHHRGAARVLGIDSDRRYLRQAEFVAERLRADIELRQMSVYELPQLSEKFDLVIFMGVLYHLRHPLLALDLVRAHAARDLMLFQCMQRGSGEVAEMAADYPFSEWQVFERDDTPRLHFVEHSYAGDPTNWFIPNKSGVEAMLRSAGFRIEQNPEREVYLCSCAKDFEPRELP